ncbi:hypothetical protein KBX37_05780 [Micromonospora sp. U56]|uniref:hypothetical protein n=1 Tax=Micromonospora sp. U56 TaxID=2824900 RepID=UPI001B367E39|nr:hypothetical protein [Micromonospora sp. U56]MBQ0892618.1 hypothetical protein [Micromonospora sp. U56]
MTDDRTQQSDRVEIDTPNVPVAPTITPFVYYDGVSLDNVNKAHRPTHLTPAPGGAGAKTEWDASTLDKAITWLDDHADFLNQQSYKMEEDIRKWMRNATGAAAVGGGGEKSPLGSFERANALATKHAGLYDSTQTRLRELARELWKAANALRTVKENYDTADERNRMNANQMQNAINSASSRAGKN